MHAKQAVEKTNNFGNEGKNDVAWLRLYMYMRLAVQTAVKQELKKANAAAAVTQMSVAGMGAEEQGAAARGSPDSDGTGTAARKSEKVSHAWSLQTAWF